MSYADEIMKKGIFKVVVKPNARSNEIVTYDEGREAFIVQIKAEARDNKANIELIKFFSRLLKTQVRILRGATSRKKCSR